MRLRDLPFAPYDQIQLFDDLTPSTIEGLPAAIAAYIDAATVELRLPAGGSGESCLERMPDGASLVDLAARARVRSLAAPSAFPFTVTASGSRVAISVPHDLMDGRILVEFLPWVIARAAGATTPLELPAPVRRPYLAMVRTHLTRALLRDFRAAREASLPGPVLPAPTDADLARTTAAIVGMQIGPADLARLAAVEARGTSVGMRVGSLAVDALARVYLSEQDLPVRVPIDLRRFAPKGRIAGNFVTVGPLGALLASDWSAKAIGTRLTAEVRSKHPVARSALWTASVLRRAPLGRIRRGRRPAAAAPLEVSLSMVAGPIDYPDDAWLPGAERLCAAAVIGPAWPSATFVLVLQLGTTVRLSVWDESGLFDLDRFPAALRAALEAREG